MAEVGTDESVNESACEQTMIDLEKIYQWTRAARLSIANGRRMTIAAMLLASTHATAVHAQEDPFGATAGQPAMNAQPAADAAAAPVVSNATGTRPADESDPYVRILRLSPPKTPEEYARAIESMTRIGRWDEVGRYLDALQKAGWSNDQLDQLSQAGGASLWFKLRDATTELTEPQRNFVRDLAALPARLSPMRVGSIAGSRDSAHRTWPNDVRLKRDCYELAARVLSDCPHTCSQAIHKSMELTWPMRCWRLIPKAKRR